MALARCLAATMVTFCAILSCALPAAASDSLTPAPTLAPLPAPHIYDVAYAPGWQMVAGPTGAILLSELVLAWPTGVDTNGNFTDYSAGNDGC